MATLYRILQGEEDGPPPLAPPAALASTSHQPGARCAWASSNVIAMASQSLRSTAVLFDANSPQDAHVNLHAPTETANTSSPSLPPLSQSSTAAIASAQHVVFHSNGALLATASSGNGRVCIWRMECTIHEWNLVFDHTIGEPLVSLQFISRDLDVLVSGGVGDVPLQAGPFFSDRYLWLGAPGMASPGAVLLGITPTGRAVVFAHDGFRFQVAATHLPVVGGIITHTATVSSRNRNSVLIAVRRRPTHTDVLVGETGSVFELFVDMKEMSAGVTDGLALFVDPHSRFSVGDNVCALAPLMAPQGVQHDRLAIVTMPPGQVKVETLELTEQSSPSGRPTNAWVPMASQSFEMPAETFVASVESVRSSSRLAVTLTDGRLICISGETEGALVGTWVTVETSTLSPSPAVISSCLSPNSTAILMLRADLTALVAVLPDCGNAVTLSDALPSLFLSALLTGRDYWDIVLACARLGTTWPSVASSLGRLATYHASSASLGSALSLSYSSLLGLRAVLARQFPGRLTSMVDAYCDLQLGRIADVFRSVLAAPKYDVDSLMKKVEQFRQLEALAATEGATPLSQDALALVPLAAWVLNLAFVSLISLFYQHQTYLSMHSQQMDESHAFPDVPAASIVGRPASRQMLMRTVVYITRLRALPLATQTGQSQQQDGKNLFDAVVPMRMHISHVYSALVTISNKPGDVIEAYGRTIFLPQIPPDIQVGRLSALALVTDEMELAPALGQDEGGVYMNQVQDAHVAEYRLGAGQKCLPRGPGRLRLDVVRMVRLAPSSQLLRQCTRCFRYSEAMEAPAKEAKEAKDGHVGGGKDGHVGSGKDGLGGHVSSLPYWARMYVRACVCGGRWRSVQAEEGVVSGSANSASGSANSASGSVISGSGSVISGSGSGSAISGR